MSSGDGGDPVSPNFFTNLTTFPTVTEDGKVDTTQFLEAAKAFIQIYDLLGAAFYVVKKDMSGNIEKLYKTYNKSPEKYKFLNDLISEERDDPNLFAVESLLWLKRALEFTIFFINGICDAFEKGTDFDRLDDIATEAYNTTLKKYHMWLVQNVFKVVVKSVPNRSGLVKALYFGKTGPEDKLFGDSRTYTRRLEENIAVIVRMYDAWGLDSDKKV
ncbi:glycolipid transfer protein [Palaemon carinicauda]|uniref:glycolipid transfer protein n=1 Tax=Palaemon carinicauda TaxID=392227 RepID=UPI0035B65E91